MFGKLLKHELRSSAPLMLILTGAALFCGFLGMAALRIMAGSADLITDVDTAMLVALPCMMLFYFSYISLFIYFTATQYILLFRFYGNRFTDRGYLTFTLPVSVHTNFLAGAVNMLIWFFVAFATLLVGIFLIFVCGMPNELFSISDVTPTEAVPWGMLLSTLFVLTVSPVYSVVLNTTAVVTACSLFKRLKVLGIFIFQYALSTTFSLVISAVMLACVIPPLAAGNDPLPAMTVFYAIMGVIMVLASVGGYFLSTYLMKNKLNLS